MQVPTVTDSVDRAAIEQLLYLEAELLDRWDLDAWLALYTDDASYVIPSNDSPDGDPRVDLVIIDDTHERMMGRVERLKSRKAHREYPHSSTSHQVTNIRVGTLEDAFLPVRAEFTVWRFRNSRESRYVGHYEYQLTVIDGSLRIKSKRVVLAMSDLRAAGDVAIIL